MSDPRDGRWERRPFDLPSYIARVQERCFICAIRDGVPGYEHEVIVDEAEAFAFLNKFPSVPGHALVVPRRHVEDVAESAASPENEVIQRLIARIGRTVRRTLPCERLYVASLGSKLSNAHVHWHIVPCPPGLPYAEQQWSLFEAGYLDIPDEDMREVADELRTVLAAGAS